MPGGRSVPPLEVYPTLAPWQTKLLLDLFIERLPTNESLTEEQCKVLAQTYFEQPSDFRQLMKDRLIDCINHDAAKFKGQ